MCPSHFRVSSLSFHHPTLPPSPQLLLFPYSTLWPLCPGKEGKSRGHWGVKEPRGADAALGCPTDRRTHVWWLPGMARAAGRCLSSGGPGDTDARPWGLLTPAPTPPLASTQARQHGKPSRAQLTSSCVMESGGDEDRKLPPGIWGLSGDSGPGGLVGERVR